MTDPIRMTANQEMAATLIHYQQVLEYLWEACEDLPIQGDEESQGALDTVANETLRAPRFPQGVRVTTQNTNSMLVRLGHALSRAISDSTSALHDLGRASIEGLNECTLSFPSDAATFGRQVGEAAPLRRAVASVLMAGGISMETREGGWMKPRTPDEINHLASTLDKSRISAMIAKVKAYKHLFALSALTFLGYEVCHAFLSSPASPEPVESKIA